MFIVWGFSCTQGLYKTLTSQRFPVFSVYSPGGHGAGDLERPFEIVSGQRSWAAGPVSISSLGAGDN